MSDEFDRDEHPELPLTVSETPPELEDEMNRLQDEEAAGSEGQESNEAELTATRRRSP